MLVCGNPEINMKELRKVTIYDGYSKHDQIIRFLCTLMDFHFHGYIVIADKCLLDIFGTSLKTSPILWRENYYDSVQEAIVFQAVECWKWISRLRGRLTLAKKCRLLIFLDLFISSLVIFEHQFAIEKHQSYIERRNK